MQRPIDYWAWNHVIVFNMCFKIQNEDPKRKENEMKST